MATYVLLVDIRSAHNVGSILRTADGAGVARVYMSGHTPAPVDRFGRSDPRIAKTALGAQTSVPWDVVPDPLEVLTTMKHAGCTIISVEQTQKAVSYTAPLPQGDRLFVFGNEVDGVPPAVLGASDLHIEIPLSGKKESLNVSVAAGIILFHARDYGVPIP